LASGAAAKQKKRPKSLRIIGLEIGVSAPTVQKYLDKGMPREGRARDRWLEKYHERVTVVSERKKEANDELRELEKELLRERIEEVRERRMRRRGELVERKAVEQSVRRLITDARVMLETVPTIVVKFIPEGDGRETARDQVQNIINKILEGLAKGK
jgi:predicted transcriptional regulator